VAKRNQDSEKEPPWRGVFVRRVDDITEALWGTRVLGWSAFLKHLKGRGLHGVRLIISDACMGLAESAADFFFPKAAWQRCIVHWYRNIFSHVPSTKALAPHPC